MDTTAPFQALLSLLRRSGSVLAISLPRWVPECLGCFRLINLHHIVIIWWRNLIWYICSICLLVTNYATIKITVTQFPPPYLHRTAHWAWRWPASGRGPVTSLPAVCGLCVPGDEAVPSCIPIHGGFAHHCLGSLVFLSFRDFPL